MKTFYVLFLSLPVLSFAISRANTQSHKTSDFNQVVNQLKINPIIADSLNSPDTSVQGVFFYHKIIQCNGADAVMISFISTNGQDKNISWQETAIIGDVEFKTPGITKTLVVHPGINSQPDCESSPNTQLIIPIQAFSNNSSDHFSSFRFYNITVN